MYNPPTLLGLPLELRMEIYTYLLTFQEPAKPSSPDSGSRTPERRPAPLHPQILRVCAQTYAEAHALLYRLNTFQAHPSLLASFPRLRAWHDPVAAAAMVPLIRRFRVRVRLDIDAPFTREEATRAFSGMELVEIEVWQAVYRGAGREVLSRFEDVRGVRTAKVTGSLSGFEEYAGWLEQEMMKGTGEDKGERYHGVDEHAHVATALDVVSWGIDQEV
ncbi:hypothetical protein JX265_011873 [Neoarthrinium moseri]|uniref:Uncharacterized protein n=1 Tax=Neoarthrinium moseri TaxID=1658444 RepID=A0A9P9WBN0_9PEZI|nr:hypothetical protein JX266_006738 [Neoarthrinium moseri]KAI1856158.1 hypothetical protein JX265_011873 [Neoarthrinium moseri]